MLHPKYKGYKFKVAILLRLIQRNIVSVEKNIKAICVSISFL